MARLNILTDVSQLRELYASKIDEFDRTKLRLLDDEDSYTRVRASQALLFRSRRRKNDGR